MFCSNDWPPGLSYFLVVLNTAAVEGVSVQKTALDAGHKFLSEHAFHPQKDRAKHLNPSFSAILSHRINMLLRGDPRLPLHSNQEELAGNGERPMPISVVLELAVLDSPHVRVAISQC